MLQGNKDSYLVLEVISKLVMFPIFLDNASVSLLYSEFIEEYHKVLKYSAQVSQILVLVKTLEKGSMKLLPLYMQAVKAHSAAINAYIRMVAIHEQLFQKCWNNVHGRGFNKGNPKV